NLLPREVQKGISSFLPLYDTPFWTRCIPPRDLGIQAATEPSRSSRTVTGWWPNMAQDVARYVKGCLVCAITSTPHHLPEGKLVPLPIPRQPWSHLGIDFTTDLPPSNGCTTIFVVVDQFSKACMLIPLHGLPTALEAAEALFQHLFRNFGLPEDIVSDQGPQFISRAWLGFFQLLGVS
ncbi:hypothetical protein M9458_041671, partial [Cirrhinus mrigala]